MPWYCDKSANETCPAAFPPGVCSSCNHLKSKYTVDTDSYRVSEQGGIHLINATDIYAVLQEIKALLEKHLAEKH